MVAFAKPLPSSSCALRLVKGHRLQFNTHFIQQCIEVMPGCNTIATLKYDGCL